jgi:hypothetical protein
MKWAKYVIAIIIVVFLFLTFIVLFGLRGGPDINPNNRRAAEIAQLRGALQIYYNEFKTLPETLNLEELRKIDLNYLPKDPILGIDYQYQKKTETSFTLSSIYDSPQERATYESKSYPCIEERRYCYDFSVE